MEKTRLRGALETILELRASVDALLEEGAEIDWLLPELASYAACDERELLRDGWAFIEPIGARDGALHAMHTLARLVGAWAERALGASVTRHHDESSCFVVRASAPGALGALRALEGTHQVLTGDGASSSCVVRVGAQVSLAESGVDAESIQVLRGSARPNEHYFGVRAGAHSMVVRDRGQGSREFANSGVLARVARGDDVAPEHVMWTDTAIWHSEFGRFDHPVDEAIESIALASAITRR